MIVLSFRLKTILGITLIQTLLLCILILYGMRILISSHEQALLAHASTAARLFATITQDAVIATDLGSLENAVSQTLKNSDIVYARVIGEHGVLAEGGDRAARARPFIADLDYQSAYDGIFDITLPISVDGEQYGRVELGLAISTIKNTIASAQRETTILAISAMAIVAALSYLFAMYLTRRLSNLTAASRSIAAGMFGRQIEIHGTDELAQTAIAFNEMSRQLEQLEEHRQHAEKEIMNLNAELESRVIVRTDQLSKANKELEYLALHDALTKLPNRTLFHDRVEQAILLAEREMKSFALLSLDLDCFKLINDGLGHLTGDIVLQEVSTRLVQCLRHSDTVARMGGDEFSILLLNTTTMDDVIAMVDNIVKAITTPIMVNGTDLKVGASIGIATFPEHGQNINALISHADAAMYVAKRAQKTSVVYSAEVEKESGEHQELRFELQRAIDNEELILHYQPKIDFGSQHIVGVEALVRWRHPKHGLLYPDEFIAIAEKNKLMKPLTLRVLDIALRQCKRWHQSDLYLIVAVNISSANLQDPSFPDCVQALLTKYAMSAQYVELEITESAILIDPLRAIDNITKLSEIGVQVSIDDFGMGYSSIAYLHNLLVAKIKIDKSFVIEMDKNHKNSVIVRSTIELGHNLGLKVVAEGVESQDSWDRLKNMGCDSAQGYFMSRPIPAEELLGWIKESPFGTK